MPWFLFSFSLDIHLSTIDLILVSILCKNQISVGANSHRFSSYFSVWQLKLVRKMFSLGYLASVTHSNQFLVYFCFLHRYVFINAISKKLVAMRSQIPLFKKNYSYKELMLNNAFSNFLLTRKNISYFRETKLEGQENLLDTLIQCIKAGFSN